MDDVRENEMLHIENSELRYTNRALLAQLDEARAALDKATKSEPFILNDELQHLRTSNHYMTEELTRLRAERKAEAKDLAEARADVQRFEAALDVANRELAEARDMNRSLLAQLDEARAGEKVWVAIADVRGKLCGDLSQQYERRLRTIAALVVAFRCAMLFVKTADMKWLRAAIKIERGRANQTTHD